MKNFTFWEAGVGLKMFEPKYQKAHPYCKFGRIKRLVYVAVALFKCYTRGEKKVRENAHWKFESSITLQPLSR